MAQRVLLRLLPCLLCLVLLLLYAASVLLAASPPRHRQSLRTALVVEDRSGGLLAMHWNINTAAEPDRLAEIGAVIRTHAPALVGLNEVALGPSAFARAAKAWGFAHSLLLKTDGPHRFNLGLMSTTPLERHPSTTASPFFHGVLCARLPAWHGAHACVTHLTPHSPAKRLSEAKTLRRLLPAGPTLLLGDLNALSPRDAAAHRATGLRDRLAASGSWEKFSVGMPPHGPTPKPEGDPGGDPREIPREVRPGVRSGMLTRAHPTVRQATSSTTPHCRHSPRPMRCVTCTQVGWSDDRLTHHPPSPNLALIRPQP